MPFPVRCALVFLALCAVDYCWTFYIAKVGEGRAIAAATWSALIMVCGAFATISYLDDRRLLVAAIAGAWVGTCCAVHYAHRKGSIS